MIVLLAGLVGAAIGVVGYQRGLEDVADEEELSVASLIGGLLVLALSYLVGGWAAARIARYDGVRNGIMTVVWTVLLAAILSALAAWAGDEYDVFRNVDLPQFFSEEALTIGAIVSALIAIAAMVVGAALGGALGERYHRRADATIAAAT
jgi:MFS family permease